MSSPSDANDAQSPPILLLVRDLIFATRIGATARAIDVAVKLLRDESKLAGEDGRSLIVDLNQAGALAAAIQWKQTRTNRIVVGFVSHVDADTIRQAREAGIDQVLPRSRFVAELPALFRNL